MKALPIKVLVTNLDEFLKQQKPINTSYKSCFRCLTELEDEVIKKFKLGIPIDYIEGQTVEIEYKEDGFYIFEFIKHRLDELGVLNYHFKFRI